MKSSYFIKLLVLAIGLAIGPVGCLKKGVKGPTPIGSNKSITGSGTSGPIDDDPLKVPDVAPVPGGLDPTIKIGDPKPLSSLELIKGMIPDREYFKNETIYFEYNLSTIRLTETAKASTVANYLKQNSNFRVQVEGHCDERGTEEYNRSLGERRALAVREHLVHLGIAGDRVFTLSWGEDKPADPGHDESAWDKNRRGEFILLKPKP